jgi:hypothetical protein
VETASDTSRPIESRPESSGKLSQIPECSLQACTQGPLITATKLQAAGSSTTHGRHKLGKPDYFEHPSEIIGERQAELTANFLQATHEERALVHPLFDRAEWMPHRLPVSREKLWALCQPGLHPVKEGLVSMRDTQRKLLLVHRERMAQSRHACLLAQLIFLSLRDTDDE